MGDVVRYARVFAMLGVVAIAAILGIKDTIGWTLSFNPPVWAMDDRHLRLSVDESQNAKNDAQPYESGKFQAQYEKL